MIEQTMNTIPNVCALKRLDASRHDHRPTRSPKKS